MKLWSSLHVNWLQASKWRAKITWHSPWINDALLRDKEWSEHSTQKTRILFKGSLSANAIQSRNRNGPASEQQTPKSSDLARRSWYKHAGVGLPSVEKSLSRAQGLKGWCSYLINLIPHEYAFSSKWQLANHWHIASILSLCHLWLKRVTLGLLSGRRDMDISETSKQIGVSQGAWLHWRKAAENSSWRAAGRVCNERF